MSTIGLSQQVINCHLICGKLFKRMTDEIIKDALQLCDKAIRTMSQKEDFKTGRREISIGTLVKGSYGILPDESVLYYKYQATSELLHQAGVITYSWWVDNRQTAKEVVQGYYKVIFDYDRAHEWMEDTIQLAIHSNKPKSRIDFKGNLLIVHLKDGDYPLTFTTRRKTNDMRDVFSLLYDRHNKGDNSRMTTNDIAFFIAKQRKIEIQDLPNGFVKTTIRHIREKLSSDEHISGIVEIGYKDGYFLIVK